MKRKWNWGMWLMCGLMVLCLAATGCKDDDDKDSGDGGPGGGGSTAPGGGSADPGGGGGDGGGVLNTNVFSVLLAAPQLVSPANEETQTASGATKSVTFRWTAVPTATGYILVLKNTEIPVAGTSHTRVLDVDPSSYYGWKVRAVRGDQAGPFSETRRLYVRNFEVRP